MGAMRIVVAGGTGLIGKALTDRLLADGHTVVVLSRGQAPAPRGSRGPEVVAWNPDGSVGPWASTIDGADAIVNLTGAGIADKRWTPARKSLLASSRVLSTRSLVGAVGVATKRPAVFVQGSAVGYYGASLDPNPIDESHPPGTDFLGRLAVEWETAAQPVEALGCRLVLVRTGVVLDGRGGALPQMALPFRLFGGGPMGSGRQMISWIHIDDWVSLVVWLLGTPSASGAYNASAPEPVNSRAFSAAIGRALHRPSWFPVPGFVLRIVVGEMADVALLRGQAALPARALAQGFRFAHVDLDEALKSAFALG